MEDVSCGHDDVSVGGRVCMHLQHSTTSRDAYRYFTGDGTAYELVCAACHRAGAATARFQTVCQECFIRVSKRCYAAGFAGCIQAPERVTPLSFAHTDVNMRGVLPADIIVLRPLLTSAEGVWLTLTASRQIVQLDLAARTAITQATLPASAPPAETTMLRVSPDGRFAAVVETYGQRGVVIDLETGTETMRLERDDYCNEVSVFPIAFFVDQGCPLLVHGTKWNRLDVSDPATGRLLTARTLPSSIAGESRPQHELDYFHCGLSVSPDGAWIADNGWVWQPVGVVTTWSLRRWIEANVWESEDGPSRRALCDQDNWDKPFCWIDNRRLAVWSYQDSEPPTTRIFDVASGHEMSAVVGPLGDLIFDRFFFSFMPGCGTSVWDIETGERLLYDATFVPTAYHPTARCFVTLLPDGVVRASRLFNGEWTRVRAEQRNGDRAAAHDS